MSVAIAGICAAQGGRFSILRSEGGVLVGNVLCEERGDTFAHELGRSCCYVAAIVGLQLAIVGISIDLLRGLGGATEDRCEGRRGGYGFVLLRPCAFHLAE